MIAGIWKVLNSRRFAVYVLGGLILMLVLSTFLPNYYTLNEKEWYELEERRPQFFWIASRLSTPFLVTNPAFLVVSLFLFLSTLVCTVTRIQRWFKLRESEFSKEKAFSFSLEEKSSLAVEEITGRIRSLLSRGRWEQSAEEKDAACVISGQRGMTGFWGSVVFHIGLIICFFAGPVSVLTTFRGDLVIPENVEVALRKGFASHVGKDPSTLPDVRVRVHDFKAEFYEGRFEYDFRGILTMNDGLAPRDFPFAVNSPVDFGGYQFSLHEYGFSLRIVLRKEGNVAFDYYLNLRHPDEGDHFQLGGEDLRAEVLLFPDFVREGDRIGSKSRVPNNPVALIKLFREDKEVFKGLFKPGETRSFDGYEVQVLDLKYWVNMIVVRESGIVVLILSFVIGLGGLLLRFLSNERRLEFVLSQQNGQTLITVRGYSRYYPAFLEREVMTMAEKVKEGDYGVL